MKYILYIIGLVGLATIATPCLAAPTSIYNSSLISTTSLMDYYRLNGNANDYKGTANGTATGVTFSTAASPFSDGSDGGDFTANTTGNTTANAYITANYFSPNASNFTYYCWVEFRSTVSQIQQFLMNEENGATGKPSVGMYLTSSGHFAFFYNNSSNGYTVTSSLTAVLDKWYQVAMTESNNTLTGYVNGVSVGSVAIVTPTIDSTNGNGQIGRRYNSAYSSTQWPFNGYEADVAMFNTALTSTEISSLYGAPIPSFSPWQFFPF